MASRVEKIVDMVTEKSRYIPIGTPLGMKRMKRNIYSTLSRKAVEDEFSTLKRVDFGIIEELIRNDIEFDANSLFVDVMPKLDMSKVPIKKTNNILANALQVEGILMSTNDGIQHWKHYEMPLKKYVKKDVKECYIVYELKDGKLGYPSFKGYHSPVIKFDCYRNLNFGKNVVKSVYETLSNLEEHKKTRI